MDSFGGFSSQDWEAALTVPLPITQAAHGLHLRLEGPPLVPVPEVTRLQEVLVPAVARILIADPAGGKQEGQHGDGQSYSLAPRPLPRPVSFPSLSAANVSSRKWG